MPPWTYLESALCLGLAPACRGAQHCDLDTDGTGMRAVACLLRSPCSFLHAEPAESETRRLSPSLVLIAAPRAAWKAGALSSEQWTSLWRLHPCFVLECWLSILPRMHCVHLADPSCCQGKVWTQPLGCGPRPVPNAPQSGWHRFLLGLRAPQGGPSHLIPFGHFARGLTHCAKNFSRTQS